MYLAAAEAAEAAERCLCLKAKKNEKWEKKEKLKKGKAKINFGDITKNHSLSIDKEACGRKLNCQMGGGRVGREGGKGGKCAEEKQRVWHAHTYANRRMWGELKEIKETQAADTDTGGTDTATDRDTARDTYTEIQIQRYSYTYVQHREEKCGTRAT